MSVERLANDGSTLTFSLDIDAVRKREDADPDWTIARCAEEIGRFRIGAIFDMAELVGHDYRDLVAKGIAAEDLAGILTECLGELGFTSATPEDGTSD